MPFYLEGRGGHVLHYVVLTSFHIICYTFKTNYIGATLIISVPLMWALPHHIFNQENAPEICSCVNLLGLIFKRCSLSVTRKLQLVLWSQKLTRILIYEETTTHWIQGRPIAQAASNRMQPGKDQK